MRSVIVGGGGNRNPRPEYDLDLYENRVVNACNSISSYISSANALKLVQNQSHCYCFDFWPTVRSGLCHRKSVRPSVRPSVTLVDCGQTA